MHSCNWGVKLQGVDTKLFSRKKLSSGTNKEIKSKNAVRRNVTRTMAKNNKYLCMKENSVFLYSFQLRFDLLFCSYFSFVGTLQKVGLRISIFSSVFLMFRRIFPNDFDVKLRVEAICLLYGQIRRIKNCIFQHSLEICSGYLYRRDGKEFVAVFSSHK